MSERKQIRYTYHSIEDYEQYDSQVSEIIKEDTDAEFWVMSRSLPPIAFPPPLNAEAIEKLKAFGGVNVIVVEDE
ncbi:hypothetical protein BDV29DRAFT_55938 [Aspergillus leporis]|uniref:Uncharacterized protein n=1 Tax=Aspergillus leporis TaxID=41062 RepID=A0A5N5X9Q7_9EURO|nr:hypothetical protein BDV29DRAFT_55938 [Aspergillus leporis]